MKRLIILAACLTSPLFAVETTSTMVECSKSSVVRKIEVTRTNNGTSESCEVIYHKPSEGAQSNTIWSADLQKGYCDEKAAGFVQKQESWGFACTGQANLAVSNLNTDNSAGSTTESTGSKSESMKDKMTDTAKKAMQGTTDTMKAGTDSTKEMMDKGTKNIKEKMNETTKSMMDKAKAKASEATGKGMDTMKKGVGSTKEGQ